jgi:hypothetical protein
MNLSNVSGKLESQETRDTKQGRLLHRRREAHVQDPQAQKPAKVRKNKTKVGAGQKTCSNVRFQTISVSGLCGRGSFFTAETKLPQQNYESNGGNA